MLDILRLTCLLWHITYEKLFIHGRHDEKTAVKKSEQQMAINNPSVEASSHINFDSQTITMIGIILLAI